MVCPICRTDCKDAVICPNCEWDLTLKTADTDRNTEVHDNCNVSTRGQRGKVCLRCGSRKYNVRLIVCPSVRPYKSARLYRYHNVYFKALAFLVHAYFYLPKIKKGHVCSCCGFIWTV